MKIAILGENYYPTVGGIQEHIFNQARQLQAMGHDVRVITGMPKVERWLGPRDEDWVIRVGNAVRYGVMGTYTTCTFGPSVVRRLAQVFRDEKFDLLHIHGPGDLGLPMLAYSLFDGPKVATLHSAFKHSIGRTLVSPWYRHVLGLNDAVIAVSELAEATMRRYADFPCQIIPNGVDVAFFQKGKRLARYDDGRKNVLYLARLEPRNGPDLLLQALPRIVAAHPNVRLLMAGSGPRGTAELEALVPPDLRDRVEFLGALEDDERPHVYASGDVFVVPARYGGSFSILVLEGLAAGVPVVSTPFVDERYRDSHWKPVKLTRDYSPEAIADGIIEVLSEDPAERVALGSEVVRDYDWSAIVRRIVDVYERVLEKRR
jgi:phosphatidylinositol alpha-mannosyltransferase